MAQIRSLLIGFLAGTLAGMVSTLLLAPQSGEETRTQIRAKSVELKDKAETTYADLQERLDSSVTELRAEMEGLTVKVEEALDQSRPVAAAE